MQIRPEVSLNVSKQEALAISRVLTAGVKADESAIHAWIRSVSPEAILRASLRDIRAIARAF